jgi:hypothetical protein
MAQSQFDCGRQPGPPGNEDAVMLVMSRSSNHESWNALPLGNAWMVGSRNAVIPSSSALHISRDACLSNHGWITCENHAVQLEAVLELLNLYGQRQRIASISLKDLDRDRTTTRGDPVQPDLLTTLSRQLPIELLCPCNPSLLPAWPAYKPPVEGQRFSKRDKCRCCASRSADMQEPAVDIHGHEQDQQIYSKVT